MDRVHESIYERWDRVKMASVRKDKTRGKNCRITQEAGTLEHLMLGLQEVKTCSKRVECCIGDVTYDNYKNTQ